MTLGQYIWLRMVEEDIELKDLDPHVIDFFYQQWLVDPEGAPRYAPHR